MADSRGARGDNSAGRSEKRCRRRRNRASSLASVPCEVRIERRSTWPAASTFFLFLFRLFGCGYGDTISIGSQLAELPVWPRRKKKKPGGRSCHRCNKISAKYRESAAERTVRLRLLERTPARAEKACSGWREAGVGRGRYRRSVMEEDGRKTKHPLFCGSALLENGQEKLSKVNNSHRPQSCQPLLSARALVLYGARTIDRNDHEAIHVIGSMPGYIGRHVLCIASIPE